MWTKIRTLLSKYWPIIAGIIGAIISLNFLKGKTRYVPQDTRQVEQERSTLDELKGASKSASRDLATLNKANDNLKKQAAELDKKAQESDKAFDDFLKRVEDTNKRISKFLGTTVLILTLLVSYQSGVQAAEDPTQQLLTDSTAVPDDFATLKTYYLELLDAARILLQERDEAVNWAKTFQAERDQAQKQRDEALAQADEYRRRCELLDQLNKELLAQNERLFTLLDEQHKELMKLFTKSSWEVGALGGVLYTGSLRPGAFIGLQVSLNL